MKLSEVSILGELARKLNVALVLEFKALYYLGSLEKINKSAESELGQNHSLCGRRLKRANGKGKFKEAREKKIKEIKEIKGDVKNQL